MATLLVNTGKAVVTNRVKNGATGATEPNYVAWGTGAGTTALTDTTLFTEVGTRTAGTSTQQTTTTTNDTYRQVNTCNLSNIDASSHASLIPIGSGLCGAIRNTRALCKGNMEETLML